MAVQRVGVLGSGVVGQVLANGFLKYNYEVMVGTRDASKLAEWKSNTGEKGHVGDFEVTVKFGDMVVLAVMGAAAEDAIKMAGIENFSDKTVIDATNPISPTSPPVNGVLNYFSDINSSLMERLQNLVPEANFVKAFSCVGNAYMINPSFPDGIPTMFICGNNDAAKEEVIAVLKQFGWEYEDMGSVEAARAIEPLAMLWCIPGMLHNRWTHAFKLLKE